jgi:hypothetical protein
MNARSLYAGKKEYHGLLHKGIVYTLVDNVTVGESGADVVATTILARRWRKKRRKE